MYFSNVFATALKAKCEVLCRFTSFSIIQTLPPVSAFTMACEKLEANSEKHGCDLLFLLSQWK